MQTDMRGSLRGLGITVAMSIALAITSTALALGDVPDGFEWSMDADCSLCHQQQVESLEDAAYLAGIAPHSTMGCLVCHSDETGMTKGHRKAATSKKEPKALKRSEVSSETCLTCHGPMDQLVEATAESKVLTDSKANVVNPHDLPGDHFEEKVTCSDCHVMHRNLADIEEADDEAGVEEGVSDNVDEATTTEDAETIDLAMAATVEASIDACLSCHHANVYECGTCH